MTRLLSTRKQQKAKLLETTTTSSCGCGRVSGVAAILPVVVILLVALQCYEDVSDNLSDNLQRWLGSDNLQRWLSTGGVTIRKINITQASNSSNIASTISEPQEEEEDALMNWTLLNTSNFVLIPPVPDPTVETFLNESNIPPEAYFYNISTSSSTTTQVCSPTSQLKTYMLQEEGQQYWMIQSLDGRGNPKTLGGDEFLVIYMDFKDHDRHRDKSTIPRSIYETPTAVALVEDLHNGMYRLEFVTSPLGPKEYSPKAGNWNRGTLYIHLQYTCGMGRLTAPHKDTWGQPGHMNKLYYRTNLTAPPIRLYQPPSLSPHNLGHYDHVLCLGDSLVRNLCGSYLKAGTTADAFSKPNLKLVTNVGQYLSNSTATELAIDELHNTYGHLLLRNNSANNNNKTKTNVAILVGSYAWDALAGFEPPGHNFQKMLKRNQRIVELLRQRYSSDNEQHNNVTIIWKGPSAVNPYILKFDECYYRKPSCKDRVRYMSNSITKFVHTKQKLLMRSLNVPYLDLFETTALSPSWSLDGDGVHYRKWLNMFMIDLFYPPEMKFSLRRRRQ